jgi:hypothetical protein
MKSKKLVLASMTLAAVFTLTACKSADVVGKVAVTSFNAVVEKMGDSVTSNDVANSWTMESPAGDKFSWSKDFSGNNPDAVVEFDAAPFINAGLDFAKLPADKYIYNKETEKIVMPYELGQDKFNYSGDITPGSTFEKIVKTKRNLIGYHEDLDHYGIGLGNGNMFEWAKDMSKNDKDIVFVLNPQPFIDAGVDPNKVDGWAFAKVNVMDDNNKKVQVDKLLKPFELN